MSALVVSKGVGGGVDSAADGHGEADSNAYVLHSEYEIATGQDPATLSAELVEYQKY